MASDPSDLGTLADLLTRAARAPQELGLSFVRDTPSADGAGELEHLSFAVIAARAAQYGAALQQRDLRRGERVLFIAPGNDVAIPWLLGAIQAGFVPIPCLPPMAAAELTVYPERIRELLRETGARVLVAGSKLLQLLASDVHIQCIALESLVQVSRPIAPAALDPDDTALILFADENVRALELSHAAILSALEVTRVALQVTGEDVLVSWLPPSQDAGLLAALLPLYCQTSAAFLSIVQYLKRPAAWLQTISRTRGTISFAQDHGYAVCVQRVRDAALADVDLTSWRAAAAVAEPTSEEVSTAFTQRFSAWGLRPSAFQNVPVIAPFARGVEGPLSDNQAALWYLAQLAPDSLAYNVSSCLRISSAYDAAVLRRALEALVQRHAALRTVFGARAGVPYRKVLDHVPLAFETHDASTWSDAELQTRLLEETERPFDLERGPLFVTRLFQRGPSEAVLLMVAHHINLDAVSLLLAGTEVAGHYARDAAVPLAAPEQSYDDFVRWQAKLLASPHGQRLRTYWARQLSSAVTTLALPTDRPRPALQTYRGGSVELTLPDTLTAALRALAQRHETTLYTVVLGAFQALLHRQAQQTDLLVATPVLGRSGLAFSEVIGYFVNTLPIRARFPAAISFNGLLAELRTTVLEALDNQDLPFPQIVEQAHVARDPSRSPLCQVLFQLQTHRAAADVSSVLRNLQSGASSSFGGLAVEPYALERKTAQFELMLDLVDFGAGLRGRLEFNTDLFDASTAERWASQFLALSQALVDAPAVAIDSLRVPGLAANPLDARERALVLEHWNATARAYPEGRVQHAIERRAQLQPEAPALVFGEQSASYGELNRSANRMAHHLRSLGAGRDVLVGVCMERSLELVTVLLAIMKAGAAYVPLDPSYPSARLTFMVRDAEPALIVADPQHLQLVQGGAARVLNSSELVAQPGPADDPTHAVAPDDLAYVIYTSGSTGRPKGVGNTHAGLWNRLCWMQEHFVLADTDCVLHKTPYSFDVSVWELFWPLMNGARLVIARPDGHKDSRYLLEEIARQRVTTLHFVPSMLDAFLSEPELTRASSLTRVICSGEALPYALMTRCFERLPWASLTNLYGPTEASIDVSVWTCVANDRGIVPIGHPIANTQLYILDEQRQPVAIGAVGELYIGGVGLARGYHGRPELTAERFVAHPFSDDPRARLYKTGDLARFAADGCIEYLGRNDDQVKIRGFRIELGEIEAVVSEHPAVQACVVVARRTPAGGMRLEAFMVPTAAASATELDAYLRGKLPEHMLPSQLTWIDALPLTHSGKADRRALLERAEHAARTAAPTPASTPQEQLLLEVWQQVLGVREISVHDNYFALGGDSIRSLQVRALARQRGLDVDVQALLSHQTIAELAATLVDKAPPEAELATAPFALLRPSDRSTLSAYEDAYPATQLQLGMLYHSELTRDSWAYHDVMSFALELGAPFREPAMRDALTAVVSRHPVLRASFDIAGYARPLQRVQRSVALPFTTRDLRGLTSPAARALIQQHIADDKARGYELSQAPLFRLAVHVLADTRIQLTLGFHHAILDGWSTATLLRELFVEYLRGTGSRGLPELQAPTHSFAAFVALEEQAVASEQSRAYFTRELAELELTRLPRWPASLRRADAGSGRVVLPLEAALCAQLTAIATQQRAPLKALLMAAHVRVLATFLGSEDVVTGQVVHGRPELAGAERVLGLFLNTLPARFRVDPQLTWAQLVTQVAERERELHPHRRFPLREVQRLVDQKLLFETAFNFVDFHLYQDLVAEGSLRVLDYEAHENTTFGLMANFVRNPSDGQLTLHLEYDAQQIADAQAQQLAQAHVLALVHMVSSVDASSAAAELRSEPERAQLAAWVSAAKRPAQQPVPVHRLFEQQAASEPERPAVQFADEVLSYGELDAWANQIAAQLSAAGVSARDVVAVCAEPSLQRVAAVLGVLKAGCAYLPLDPSFPSQRLEYMLDHARVSCALVTVTHEGASFLAARTRVLLGAPGRAASANIPVRTEHAAYVIYTSGSTGRPKGIVMPHAPLANLVAWQVAHSELPPSAATAQFSSFSFDVSFQEMLSTWASGGRLVIVPESARKDTRELGKLLAEQRIARLFVPVVVLHQLAEVAEQLQLVWPELREINTAGEQLEITQAVRALFRRHPRCRLDNQYGPSETHVATSHRLTADPASWPLKPVIGRPLPGVRAYVLDAARKPAPIGVPGELYLAGACVATGYLHDETLTAERFLPDPFVAGAERMYATGDLVRFLPDGTLEYVGRRDGQLKVRGYRVELGEVESAIVTLSEGCVLRAGVVAVPGRSQAVRHELAAYVVPSPQARLDVPQLRAALARHLPAHMLPSALHVLEALPLTPSGKVDRRALPRLHATHLQPTAAPVPAADAREAELRGLWQEVLVMGERGLGVTDDFFAHGGDSLSAVRLMARVQRRYGVELPISALIQAPTVRQLARVIANAGSATLAPSLIKLGGFTADASRPAIFCVHPVGGHVLCYVALARRLGADQPFYALQARGLSGSDQPHTSVVEMASAYAGEILAAQPQGVLHIAGWSFGGMVAIELAHQLTQAGREVAPVVVMDSIAKWQWNVQITEDDLFECVVMELFGVQLDDAGLEQIHTRDRSAKLARLGAVARERGLLPEGSSTAQLEHVFSVIQSNIQAAYDYEPRTYAGPVVLLRCTQPMPERLQRMHDLAGTAYTDASNGWAAYCPRLTILPLASDHLSIVFEPHASTVAEILRQVVNGRSDLAAAE